MRDQLTAHLRRLRTECLDAAHRVGEGSALLSRAGFAHLLLWCRRGHRPDLDGLSAHIGTLVRAGGVLVGAWVGWRIVDTHRWVAGLLAIGWSVAALCVQHYGLTIPDQTDDAEPVEKSAESAESAPAEAPVVALVRAQLGKERAIHLQDLYPVMREQLEGRDEAADDDLRALLAEHSIPIRKRVRARGVAGRSGVHRDDLPPPPSPEGGPGGPSAPVSAPVSGSGDAGQSSGPETSGDRVETSGGPTETAVRIVQDAANPARHHVVG